jgi:class 3 adenylate cyclase/CHASE2 domain-containing sensor protein
MAMNRVDPFELPISSFRSRLARNIGIGLMMGILATLIFETAVLPDIETLILDWRLASRTQQITRNTPITLLLIDEQSFDRYVSYNGIPLNFLSDVIDEVARRKPKVIGVDLILSGIQGDEPDALRLKNAIRLAGNVIISGRALPDPLLGQKNFPPPAFLTEVALAAGFQHLVTGQFGRTREGFIRTALSGIQTSNAVAVLLAQHYEGLDRPSSFNGLRSTLFTTPFTFQSAGDPNIGQIYINYNGPRSEVGDLNGTYPCIRCSVEQLRTLSDRFFTDRIVIIGSALATDANRLLTPLGKTEMWTSEIIANFTETILSGRYLYQTTRPGRLAWLVLIGLISAFFCTSRKLLPVMLWMLLLTLLLTYLLDQSMNVSCLILPYVPTLIVPWLTALGSVGARVALDDCEIRLLRDVFGRSVSPAIAQELVAKIAYERDKKTGKNIHLLSEECVSTILFLDVANFTPLSESFSPEKLFIFTNELLDRLADCVFENKGSLIRYTGDGLIALFGRPIHREDHAVLACETAKRMEEELAILNQKRQKNGEPLVHIRIGINTGKMIVGLLGGHQRYDYSVLGNEVNIAARFERLNKDFGTMILVGEETVRMLNDEFICRPLGSISLKGKTEQVSVYELVCRTGEAIAESKKHFLRSYELGFNAIRNNQVAEAIRAFHDALHYQPDDLATRKLLDRAEERTRAETEHI